MDLGPKNEAASAENLKGKLLNIKMFDNSAFPFFSLLDFNEEEERNSQQLFGGLPCTLPEEENCGFGKKVTAEEVLKFETPTKPLEEVSNSA